MKNLMTYVCEVMIWLTVPLLVGVGIWETGLQITESSHIMMKLMAVLLVFLWVFFWANLEEHLLLASTFLRDHGK